MKRVLRVGMMGLWVAVVASAAVWAAEDEESGATWTARLAVALQQKASQLPEAVVNAKPEKVAYAALALDSTRTAIDGRNCYAFRFKTPETVGALIWSFQRPPGLVRWYICPASGTMNGFRDFREKLLPRDVAGVGKKGDRFFVQKLDGAALKPLTEYILWFEFREGSPATVRCSVNVVANGGLTLSEVFPWFWEEETGVTGG